MDRPQHLEAHQLSAEERKALEDAVPAIEPLLVNRGRADVNTDAAGLEAACSEFHRLFNKRPQVFVSSFPLSTG